MSMKTILIAATALLVASTASADARDRNIRDVYKTQTTTHPVQEQVCEQVQVPNPSREQFDQNGAIVGGIIGGLIGSQIGKGDGNKAAIGVGAITGTIIGGKQEDRNTGYHTEERCTVKTRYRTTYQEVYSHSEITFFYNGRRQTLRFQR